MPTWYVVKHGSKYPEPVTVVKFTAKTVTYLELSIYGMRKFREKQANRVSSWQRFFPTKLEALDYLITQAKERYGFAVEACKLVEAEVKHLEGLRREEIEKEYE